MVLPRAAPTVLAVRHRATPAVAALPDPAAVIQVAVPVVEDSPEVVAVLVAEDSLEAEAVQAEAVEDHIADKYAVRQMDKERF